MPNISILFAHSLDITIVSTFILIHSNTFYWVCTNYKPDITVPNIQVEKGGVRRKGSAKALTGPTWHVFRASEELCLTRVAWEPWGVTREGMCNRSCRTCEAFSRETEAEQGSAPCPGSFGQKRPSWILSRMLGRWCSSKQGCQLACLARASMVLLLVAFASPPPLAVL